jgi:hypothetical protein
MFAAMTSLTGGGGLSTSASADGDNTFENALNFKTNSAGANTNQTVIIAAAVVVGIFLLTRGKK